MVLPARRRLLLCAPPAALTALEPLVGAWQGAGIDVEIETFPGAPPDIAARLALAGVTFDAALLVSSARRAPGTSLAAPFAERADGRRIPVAWLPYRDDVSLRRFAVTAAHVQRRGGERRAVALLGQWLPNYLRVSDRMVRITDAGGVRAFRWTGDALTRDGERMRDYAETLLQSIGQ